MTQSELLEYPDRDVLCEAYVAFPDGAGAHPCVLLAHDWGGRLDHMDRRADALAGMGYLAVAIDVYGKGSRGSVEGDNSHLMDPFVEDRAVLARRLLAALDAVSAHPKVDPSRIVIVGYCFGGLCALDLARTGDDRIKGAVSIHGILSPPPRTAERMKASVLVLHGWEDPMAPPGDVLALADELTKAGADWQLHAYGQTMHAFTAKGMNAPERGLAYNELADRRATAALAGFLKEQFTLEGT